MSIFHFFYVFATFNLIKLREFFGCGRVYVLCTYLVIQYILYCIIYDYERGNALFTIQFQQHLDIPCGRMFCYLCKQLLSLDLAFMSTVPQVSGKL